ncbi:DUF1127 domain-containing protein [Bradyrhizobium sp. WSM2793]|uniref:DUF1127 domain-containing protein n=1 Tax=Bradyrhizobium sp. WSM2793 TaxID=1038866 RepID=UPI001FD8EF96|nr:DUF1127 domain-containing protein [Bradyrhizobium sp. WSM2793]
MIWSARRRRPSPLAMIASVWQRLAEIVCTRRERSSARRQLVMMSDRELLDCGMSRSEIEYELKKPFRRN